MAGSFSVDREELAWAAGFFDGEGCFSYTEKAGFATVTIGQVDRRVLDRFLKAVGVGNICGPYLTKSPSRLSKQPQFQYRAHRREHVQAIAAMLWFQLGPIKREQAKSVVRQLARRCAKGHILTQRRGCPMCVTNAWASKRGAVSKEDQTELPLNNSRQGRLASMRCLSLKIPDAMHAKLLHEADRRGLTVSDVTREAIAAYLGPERHHVLRSAASFRSAKGDLSTHVDEILGEILDQKRSNDEL